jgi:hypothetical protein
MNVLCLSKWSNKAHALATLSSLLLKKELKHSRRGHESERLSLAADADTPENARERRGTPTRRYADTPTQRLRRAVSLSSPVVEPDKAIHTLS